MELPELKIKDEYIDIPPIFHSFLEEGPFTRCVVCEDFVLEDGKQYCIEKAFKKDEVIFEYAICMSCLEKFRKSYSIDSKKVIDECFNERVNLVDRRKNLLENDQLNVDDWLSKCVVTNKPMSEVSEYQIFGQCHGPVLLFSYLPFMVQRQVLNELYEKLSASTKGENDRFVSDYLNKLPDFSDILNRPPLVLV